MSVPLREWVAPGSLSGPDVPVLSPVDNRVQPVCQASDTLNVPDKSGGGTNLYKG